MQSEIKIKQEELKKIYQELKDLEHKGGGYLQKERGRLVDEYKKTSKEIKKMFEELTEERYDPQEVLDYLDGVRKSGAINMYAAVPYIQQEFQLSKKTARWLLGEWMDSYEQRHKAGE